MSAIFIDEGIFLSFLVRDNDKRYARAREIFEQAENGRERLETNELVLYEVVRTLEDKYTMSRETIIRILEAILGTRNLRLSGRRVIRQAVELYASGHMDFPEAFNTAYAGERGLRLLKEASV